MNAATMETLADVVSAQAETEEFEAQAIELVKKTIETGLFFWVAPPVMAVLERLIGEALRSEAEGCYLADLLDDNEIWHAVNTATHKGRAATAFLDVLRQRTRELVTPAPETHTPTEESTPTQVSEPTPDINELAYRLLDELVDTGYSTRIEPDLYRRVLVAIERMVAEAEREKNCVAQILGEYVEVAEAVTAATRGGKAIALINGLKHMARSAREADARLMRAMMKPANWIAPPTIRPNPHGPRIGNNGKTANKRDALLAKGKTPDQLRRERSERDRMRGTGSTVPRKKGKKGK